MITFGNYNNFEKTLEQIIDKLEKEIKYSKDYNIYEEDGLKHYEFMLPGFEKDEIRVELNHKNEIVVTTSKSKTTRQYLERNVPSTKNFKVQIQPELINEDIKTKFENSVLTLSFKQQNNPKIIKIN